MTAKPLLKISGILLATILLAYLLVSCNFDDEPYFPSLVTRPHHTLEPGQTTRPGSEDPDQPAVLSAALPIRAETAEAVRLLFLAKTSNLLELQTGQYIGLQVMIDDLRQFDNGLELELITVPLDEGATADLVRLWQSAGNLPDIIYTRSAISSLGQDLIMPLDSLLHDNPLLTAGHVNGTSLSGLRAGKSVMGIPWMASFPVICINRALAEELKLTVLPDRWTWASFREFVESAQAAIRDAGRSAAPAEIALLSDNPEALGELLTRALFVMDNPAPLLTYLPAAFDSNAGWAAWDGQSFRLDETAFAESLSWLEQTFADSCASLNLNPDQRQIAFSGQNPVETGRVLMWLSDSVSVLNSTAAAANELIIRRMPGFLPSESAGSVAGNDALHLTPRALFISGTSNNPELAAAFAAFIALDADSILMQSRYQAFQGLVPLINDRMAWNVMAAGQGSWRYLFDFQSELPSAVIGGQQMIGRWDAAIESLFSDYGPDLILAEREGIAPSVIEQMMAQSIRILKGE